MLLRANWVMLLISTPTQALANKSGERFALDSYRRFIMMYVCVRVCV